MNDHSFFETAKAIVSPVQSDADAKLRHAAARVDEAYDTLIREHYQGDYTYIEAAYDDAEPFTTAAEQALQKLAEGLIDFQAHLSEELRGIGIEVESPGGMAERISDVISDMITHDYGYGCQQHHEYTAWAGAALRYAVAKRLADAEKLRRAFEQKLDRALSEAGK